MTTPTRRLSYANVTATAALALALGGGSAAVAAGLAPNSVGSTQIKNGAVLGLDVKNDSLTGADVVESSLGTVPRSSVTANVLAAKVSAAGTLLESRFATAVLRDSDGRYFVTFDRDVSACTPVVSMTDPVGSNAQFGQISASTAVASQQVTQVYVATTNAAGNTFEDQAFSLALVC